MDCVLCKFALGRPSRATVVLDGASLCTPHASDVLNKAPYVWLDMNGALHIESTVDALSHATQNN